MHTINKKVNLSTKQAECFNRTVVGAKPEKRLKFFCVTKGAFKDHQNKTKMLDDLSYKNDPLHVSLGSPNYDSTGSATQKGGKYKNRVQQKLEEIKANSIAKDDLRFWNDENFVLN